MQHPGRNGCSRHSPHSRWLWPAEGCCGRLRVAVGGQYSPQPHGCGGCEPTAITATTAAWAMRHGSGARPLPQICKISRPPPRPTAANSHPPHPRGCGGCGSTATIATTATTAHSHGPQPHGCRRYYPQPRGCEGFAPQPPTATAHRPASLPWESGQPTHRRHGPKDALVCRAVRHSPRLPLHFLRGQRPLKGPVLGFRSAASADRLIPVGHLTAQSLAGLDVPRVSGPCQGQQRPVHDRSRGMHMTHAT